ncbi:KilA-N domain-containing protein [Acinetobacter sichuanensis]|uniref:KilA-N domain-containing protein n=1 Tax=Acinetobacter sichuanensis TaxID=2136183 RepID=A0A371YJS3_9GAMM|nr:KilA-N domain-containing protein [Acinetobacter sichuanensis]RFC81614.1 KilA-N domain-containing protein [Acinetobacter sichuanensis]
MTSLTQNFLNPNNKPLVLGEFTIRQDEDGRYCLNDLHNASGGLKKHQITNFLRVEQTQELVVEIERCSNVSIDENSQTSNMRFGNKALNIIRGGANRGTYAVKEMVYAYAMWISAKFHLIVIRAYDALVMDWKINDKQTISPEQAGVLYNIVHTRAKGNGGIIASMWSRLKNHFKYSASYRELKAYHFEDAKFYLENIEIKEKAAPKAQNATELNDILKTNLQGLAIHMVWLNDWWKEFGGAIAKLNPNIAASVNHHFKDGACFAYHFIDKGTRLQIEEQLQYHSWNLSLQERYALDFKCK